MPVLSVRSAAFLALLLMPGSVAGALAAETPLPDAIAAPGETAVLTGVTTVQRINTKGGKLDGACDKAGTFSSAPYSADYVFLRKG